MGLCCATSPSSLAFSVVTVLDAIQGEEQRHGPLGTGNTPVSV